MIPIFIMPNEKIKYFPSEKWATIGRHQSAYGEKYAISNYGRIVKFTNQIKNGSLLKGSLQQGYPIWRFKKSGEHKHHLIHRLVAEYFLPKPKRNQKIIIHLNFNKKDNHYKNLQWVTQLEATAHQIKNPVVIKAKKKIRESIGSSSNSKLTVAKVVTIKKLLASGKTLKEIALRFGVSDMQIHRIKTGENWKFVK